MKFVVLGGYGIIGSVIVRDLFNSCKDCEIVIAGRDFKKALEYAKSFKSERVTASEADVNNAVATAKLLSGCEVCINAVQYYFNLEIMKACLRAKCNYVDLGGLFHMTKKQLKLDKDFKKIGRSAVLGCGSTPGITNVLAAYGAEIIQKPLEMHISFADWDKTKYQQPFVLPYSLSTIFDEFMMEPAVFSKGKLTFEKPGSGEKVLYFPKPFGKLKGFYTLHSELATFPESFKLKECTFRVTFSEEFQEQIRFLIEAGFASEKGIKVDGKEIKPRNFTVRVMDQWLPKPETKIADSELVRVEVIGSGKKAVVDCVTPTNKKYNLSGGTWHTATPARIIAQMIAREEIAKQGVFAPENAIPPKDFFKELKKRGSYIYLNGKKIN